MRDPLKPARYFIWVLQLFALAILIFAIYTGARAATPAPVLQGCPAPYPSVVLSTKVAVVWSVVSQGDALGQSNLRCATIASAAPAWTVKYSLDSGTTWKWGMLASLQAPAAPATTATLTWVAPTVDTNSNALAGPITYNVYRGTTATTLTKLKTVAAPSTTDTVTVNGTYWYQVTAVVGGLESLPTAAVSAALISGTVASPAPPTSLTIH